MTIQANITLPAHVNPAQVYSYDLYNDPLFGSEPHDGLMALRAKAPSVFWTPENGGHWVVLDPALIKHILLTTSDFSSSQFQIPLRENAPRLIPSTLDGEEHLRYRRLLMEHFTPSAVAKLQPFFKQRADEIIKALVPQKGCEFVEAVAAPLPVKLIMEVVGFPLERFEEFRVMADGIFGAKDVETGQRYAQQIYDEVEKLILERQAAPKSDLLSHLLTLEIEGRKFTIDELKSTAFTLFVGGLDTVVTAMTFGMRHLARDQALQAELRAHPEKIAMLPDELLRRYTMAQLARVITRDVEVGGAHMKKGEQVLVILPMIGLDEGFNKNAAVVDINRSPCTHMAFGQGPHLCLGRFLAKMELTMLYETWLANIPTFTMDTSHPELPVRGGNVLAVTELWLKW